MPRDGRAYIEKIKGDGRDVRLYGKRVADVTTHRGFKNSLHSYAGLYDFQCAPENIEMMTFTSPSTGERVNRACQCQRSYRELTERRDAMVAWN